MMKVDVEIDFSNLTVTQVGEPKFVMWYVSESDESGATRYDTTKAVSIDEEGWTAIYESGGDFEAAGIELETTPAPGIEHYIEAMSAPRIPIQLVEDEADGSGTAGDTDGEAAGV